MAEAHHQIFNRSRVKQHQSRALASPEDFLLRAVLERLTDRLCDIARTFPVALDLGSGGLLREYLPESAAIERLISIGPPKADVLADEELLPFADNSFDLIIGGATLHWVNDLPGLLVQIRRALKPDGLFLAMMPGGETLSELRASFEAAEMKQSGGISPRISPFLDIRDAGGLLQRAGFALPVVDSEQIEVLYTHPLKLLHDLRRMGQTNALLQSRKGFTPCSLMMAMADYYMEHFPAEDGRVRASFELLTLTAWKPHVSQQQPARRGSGKVNMAVLGED